MPGIIAVEKEGFPPQPLGGGVTRWTSPELYEKHKAQISFIEHPANRYIEPHSHTVDEVIYLLDGGLEIDGRPGPLPAGSILFVGAHTVYGFKVGPQGVRWIFVRPTKPDVDISKTDLRPAARTEHGQHRAQIVSAGEIDRLPWRQAGHGLAERCVIAAAGYPRVSFFRASERSAVRQVANRAQFLYVVAGALRVDGQVCRAEGVVSVPAGNAYTASGAGGDCTYLMVEEAGPFPRG